MGEVVVGLAQEQAIGLIADGSRTHDFDVPGGHSCLAVHLTGVEEAGIGGVAAHHVLYVMSCRGERIVSQFPAGLELGAGVNKEAHVAVQVQRPGKVGAGRQIHLAVLLLAGVNGLLYRCRILRAAVARGTEITHIVALGSSRCGQVKLG